MFKWLIDWHLDRLVAKEKASLPAVDWQAILNAIGGDIEPGSRIYLESRDQRFVPINAQDPPAQGLDIVGVIVTWSRDDLQPWETKEQAANLAQQLAANKDLSAVVLLSRDPASFVGYYVRIRKSPNPTP